MAKISLTAGRIRDFACPPDKQQIFLWDSVTEGLGLRATKGSKTFIFQGKLAGNAIRVTIGNPNDWGIDDARRKARELKKLIDNGRDPRIVKAEVTAADIAKREQIRIQQTSALEAWEKYIEARTPKWSVRHKADHESMSRLGGEKITRGKRAGMSDTKEQGILRPLLDLPLSQITRDSVLSWLNIEAPKRPTRTKLAVSVLKTFLTWCSDQPEYRDQVNTNACERMKQHLPKQKIKEDCLQREQLALWFEYVRRIPNPTHAAYLQCLLLTGARRNEIAVLRWNDINFQWDYIVIKDKVDGTRTIPLTPYVKSLLLELRRLNDSPPNLLSLNRLNSQGENWEPSKWVFSSTRSAKGYIQEPRISHNKALASAGLPELSIHGLRRSFGTLCEWVETPAGISAQIMGHSPSATAEKHYRRRTVDQLRVWHIKIEAWILQQAGIEVPKESNPVKLVAAQ